MIKQLLQKILFLAMLILFSQQAFSQLPAFSLTVSKTDETCTANGTLNFSVSGTTAGSSVIYRVFRLPDVTTPIVATALNTFTGLVAGNYRVIATQSLGNESNLQQSEITILNRIQHMTFNLQIIDPVCGNDGNVTINVLTGTATQYEIIVGPVLRPLQTSAVFNNLPSGNYRVRAFDNCNNGIVQSFTLTRALPRIDIRHQSVNAVDCNRLQSIDYFEAASNAIVAFPIVVTYTVTTPTGAIQTFTQTSNTPNVVQMLPFFHGQNYSFFTTAVDRCGNSFRGNRVNINALSSASMSVSVLGCNRRLLQLYPNEYSVPPFTVAFTNSPPGFNPVQYNSNYPGPFSSNYIGFQNTSGLLPSGNYALRITDGCGQVSNAQINVSPVVAPISSFSVYTKPACERGFGSLSFATTQLIRVTMLSAPTTYSLIMPHSFPYHPEGAGFVLGNLPPGRYVFRTEDICHSINTFEVIIEGYQVLSSNITVVPKCNSFDLDVRHIINTVYTQHIQYWLQKWIPEANAWGHPQTNFTGTFHPIYPTNALIINNNAVNTNLPYTGRFRVMKTFTAYNENTGEDECIEEICNFEYTGRPEINTIYPFQCENGTYDVIVDATGTAPLRYRITAKNGLPFSVPPTTSNVFLGLQPAIYTFEIEDACNQIRSAQFDVNNPVPFPVTPFQLCSGQTASLTVPRFTFLTYKWWKDNNTTTVLSTTNQLNFPSFNSATDFGTYHVRVSYVGNPNSCIDFVLDYQISPNESNPQAGTGSTVSYCGNQGVINLFSLLNGPFDTHGNWQEITNSGSLSNNLWNSATATPGIYQFKYKVQGSCGVFAESTVSITLKEVPENPIPFLEQVVCDTQTLYLLATTVPGANYIWSGPNGFSSSEQNPIIENVTAVNNGLYNVKAVANGCESTATALEIKVNPLPKMTLAKYCENNQMLLMATAEIADFNPETASFSWVGPENFTASGNPVNISNGPKGWYEVAVTSVEGCTVNAQIEVDGTACMIPAGVSPNNDNRNDTFDLSGFDVLNLKIYNRYGRMVFEKDNYTNEWYGQDFNNRKLPDATYYYYIKMISGEARTGWVYVIH